MDISVERTGFALTVQQNLVLDGITALFGPSGSGKTTLLRVIAGLENQAVGRVAFDATVWQHGRQRVPPHRRRVGYVFQDGRLFSHLTVEGNLRFALDRARHRAGESGGIGFADVVAALDLTSLLNRQPRSLSGGEQQRVAIGRALLTSPQLLLMDEPLSSLDTNRKREILPYIEKLPSAFNLPVLYVTHNVDEVARLAANVLLLIDGRVAAHGKVADVLERIDLWTFTGGREAGAVLQARVHSQRSGIASLSLGEQVLHVPMTDARAGAVLRIRIHARDVAIATLRPRQLSIRNILSARILRIDLDASVYVELLLAVDEQHLRARITRDALEELGLESGQQVFALIKSVALESTLLG
ncbi:MAG TPA: molybdenum ABC transporter ATP-binding protein [Gammaproteobacteria bacterium]|nr:molybdenum ABC transporter ATP-binding protein [Gammaproteobacteria bacterium]